MVRRGGGEAGLEDLLFVVTVSSATATEAAGSEAALGGSGMVSTTVFVLTTGSGSFCDIVNKGMEWWL